MAVYGPAGGAARSQVGFSPHVQEGRQPRISACKWDPNFDPATLLGHTCHSSLPHFVLPWVDQSGGCKHKLKFMRIKEGHVDYGVVSTYSWLLLNVLM